MTGINTVLLRTHDSYRINLECIKSDLETFCRAAEVNDSEDGWIEQAEAALAVYKVGYMADKDYVWLTEHQSFYEQIFEKLCLKLSLVYEKKGKPDMAMSTAHMWMRQSPLSEEACARLITLYNKIGEKQRAADVFKAFRQGYQSELGEEPSKALAKLVN
jgi:two-component SAPR family response regulator